MDLTGVDANGVSQQVIAKVQQFRVQLEDPRNTNRLPTSLTLNMAIDRQDAEYIVECLRVFLQHERMAEKVTLSLFNHGGISDKAVDVFGRFLRETAAPLMLLNLYNLPPQQVRRLLTALKNNASIKDLIIYKLLDSEGSSWITDLLHHKTDFTDIHFYYCCLQFTQMLPCLRGQLNLKSLSFDGCSIRSDTLLFNDPESTQAFVDNILLSPSTALKKVDLCSCGVSVENRLLMEGFHKNTTVVKLSSNSFRRFINPILRRNIYLGHVHDMLGTKKTNFPAGVIAPTIPLPCGLWSTVLAKVGQETHGASPVLTIF